MRFKKFPKDVEQLDAGMRSLTLSENFRTFIAADIPIPAGLEVAVPHQLTPRLPAGWFLTDLRLSSISGTPCVVRGETAWTDRRAYLRNVGTGDAIVSIVFLADI